MKIKLTIPLSCEEIQQITHTIRCTAEDAKIRYIATHSSEVEHDTLFLAMVGEKTCGEQFRAEVIARGGYLLTESMGERSFTVRSVSEALFALAEAHLLKLKKLKHTIGITGSVGKTTTKEMLLRFISPSFRTHATARNQNSEIGLPLTILSAPEDTEILILEMGMNHAGELEHLSRLAKPDLAIITNIGHAHIGNFGSREKIAKAKKEILLGARENAVVLVPANEPLLSDIPEKRTVSLDGTAANYVFKKDGEGDGYIFRKEGDTGMRLSVNSKDLGVLSSIAFSAAAATEIGINSFYFDEKTNFSLNIFRQNEYFKNGMRIVFDAYNASFESMLCAIESLAETSSPCRSMLIGDMLELGNYAEILHEKVGCACALAKNKIHRLYLFGTYAECIARGAIREGFACERIFINADAAHPEITARQILDREGRGSCLWIKGARGMQMERILDLLIKDSDGDNHDG